MHRIIAAAALALATALAAPAGLGATIDIVSLQYSETHPVPHFHYQGGTRAGDVARMQELFDRYVHCRNECATETGRANAVVTLRGPGGDYHEGLALADFFRANNVATVVENGHRCYSACAFAFLGGTGYSSFDRIGSYIDRMIEPGGIVGFHAPYFNEEVLRSALEARSATDVLGDSRNSLSLMVKELVKWNVDPEIMHYMLDMGPEQTYDIVGADDYYLTRTALPPLPSTVWMTDVASAIKNACIRLIALFERRDPLDLKERITSPFVEGIAKDRDGKSLSGYQLSDKVLDVGHCSATDESIATGSNLEVGLYMNGIMGSLPMLTFHNRDDYYSTAGIGASPLKRVYQRGGMGHWFLPVGINLAALENNSGILILANKFFSIASPELPPLADGFAVPPVDPAAEAEHGPGYNSPTARVSSNGNVWLFEQVGSDGLYDAALAETGRGVTLTHDSVSTTSFVREGTYADGTAFSVTGFKEGATALVVRTLVSGGQPPTADELALIRRIECGAALGSQKLAC